MRNYIFVNDPLTRTYYILWKYWVRPSDPIFSSDGLWSIQWVYVFTIYLANKLWSIYKMYRDNGDSLIVSVIRRRRRQLRVREHNRYARWESSVRTSRHGELVLATNRLSLLGDSNEVNLVILSLGNFTRVLFGTNARLDWYHCPKILIPK